MKTEIKKTIILTLNELELNTLKESLAYCYRKTEETKVQELHAKLYNLENNL